MPRRGTDPSPYWNRLQTVMKVQMGQMTAAEAARELGLSLRHYYRLEEEMLRAALGAVTPGKPGPRPKQTDPAKEALDRQLKAAERERELLRIKVQHLEEIQKEMVARMLGVERGKKEPRRDRPGRPR